MRLPYTSNPPQNLNEEDEAVVKRIQLRRGSTGLLPVDLALLHRPSIADGWNTLVGAVRSKLELPTDIRELAICRVALMNEVWLEWEAHLPLLATALHSEAHATERLAKVKELSPTNKGRLSDRQWAVLRYADEMTKHVKVPSSTFGALKDVGLSDKEIIDLTATVAAYNMVSRFIVALDIGEKGETRS